MLPLFQWKLVEDKQQGSIFVTSLYAHKAAISFFWGNYKILMRHPLCGHWFFLCPLPSKMRPLSWFQRCRITFGTVNNSKTVAGIFGQTVANTLIKLHLTSCIIRCVFNILSIVRKNMTYDCSPHIQYWGWHPFALSQCHFFSAFFCILANSGLEPHEDSNCKK